MILSTKEIKNIREIQSKISSTRASLKNTDDLSEALEKGEIQYQDVSHIEELKKNRVVMEGYLKGLEDAFSILVG
jgi:hypothetical protein